MPVASFGASPTFRGRPQSGTGLIESVFCAVDDTSDQFMACTPRFLATLPIPIQSKLLAMPGDDNLRLDKGAVLSANRSTIAKARPTGHGQPNGDAAYAHGSNVARPEADAADAADAGVQESLPAEQRELGNNLAERRVRSAWSGKATRRDSVNATISMRIGFLVGTGASGHSSRLPVNLWLTGSRLSARIFLRASK
jgi:hypothetical protein